MEMAASTYLMISKNEEKCLKEGMICFELIQIQSSETSE
jgi:hypothetical protein